MEHGTAGLLCCCMDRKGMGSVCIGKVTRSPPESLGYSDMGCPLPFGVPFLLTTKEIKGGGLLLPWQVTTSPASPPPKKKRHVALILTLLGICLTVQYHQRTSRTIPVVAHASAPPRKMLPFLRETPSAFALPHCSFTFQCCTVLRGSWCAVSDSILQFRALASLFCDF